MTAHWIMTQIKWLCMFGMILGSRSAFGTPSLLMKETVTGFRRDSVVIPCTYTPSEQHEEVRIDWDFKSISLIYRFQSQDHIPLANNRDKVSVAKSPPGDVSLTIKKLNVEDNGEYKCKVTWKESSGKFVTKEDITHLKVLKGRPATVKPDVLFVTTEETEVPTVRPATVTPDVLFATTKQPEVPTVKPVTTRPSVRIVTHKEAEVTTRTSHVEDVSSVSKINTIENSRTITKTGKFNARTTVMSMSIADVIHNNPENSARTGSGLHLYLLIITICCVLCVIVLIIVLITRKNKQKGKSLNLTVTYRQVDIEAHLPPLPGGNCQSCDNRTEAGNDYQPWNPQPMSAYEGIKPTCSNDYEPLFAHSTDMKTF
ncbi:V-set and immunoglobulin domain-containing protein 4 [Pseudophryne corroboree]|uniref:V-set and immunoglobulin domain-containing protein 4 n=1 Tax=Pseudophryne corroboree TaxID=495146 RepID=UPI003081EC84